MSPRTGRPKSLDPLVERVNIRLTAGEAAALDAYCERNETTRAEVAREGIKRILAEEKNHDDQ